MKRIFPPKVLFIILIAGIVLSVSFISNSAKESEEEEENELKEMDGPNEWFYLQRSFNNKFDYKAYRNVLGSVQSGINNKLFRQAAAAAGLNASWTLEGPGNIGGRINSVAIHPTNANIIYAGNATGGIFKTIDGGQNWFPVFDSQSYFPVGVIVFQPGNPDVIYAGTGDPNVGGYSYIGNGIYKSTDAGATWTNLGLSNECTISRICINPVDTNIIYASTIGITFYPSPERGVYKSIDGGQNWTQSLFINDSTSVIDLIMDPTDPQILYAAAWNRIRSTDYSLVHGNDSRIYKTTNGGSNWTMLTNGLPTGDLGRISLTMSGLNHDVLYASFSDTLHELLGIYKTTSGGNAWSAIPLNGLNEPFNGQGWYSGGVIVNPFNDDELMLCGVNLYKTTDGGQFWFLGAPEWWQYIVHGDMHDVKYYGPNDIYLTTDGGLYHTIDGGQNWLDIENIPNNQFYRITIDPHTGLYSGGVQDNGTTTGDASMLNNWQRIFGGDGFKIIYHPTDPATYYVETQNGGIYSISQFGQNTATAGLDTTEERNWDMPYIMSSSNPDLLYTGTTRVYKNTFGPNVFWVPISQNLVDSPYTTEARFHTISCLVESEVSNNNLYVGTSDGNVWNSTNAGNSWNNVTNTLPDLYVTSIATSKVNANVAFVSHSGYRENDYIPHVHKTTDNGNSWVDISGNLPQIAVNVIMTTDNDSLIFAGTDAGVYVTIDGGINWDRVGNNMPVVPVYDIALDINTNKLLAGTHGRSMMSYPMDSLFLGSKPVPAMNVSINVYPNPSVDNVRLDFICNKKTEALISMYNSNGMKLREFTLDSNSFLNIPVGEYSSGIYYIRVEGNGVSGLKRFVKL